MFCVSIPIQDASLGNGTGFGGRVRGPAAAQCIFAAAGLISRLLRVRATCSDHSHAPSSVTTIFILFHSMAPLPVRAVDVRATYSYDPCGPTSPRSDSMPSWAARPWPRSCCCPPSPRSRILRHPRRTYGSTIAEHHRFGLEFGRCATSGDQKRTKACRSLRAYRLPPPVASRSS